MDLNCYVSQAYISWQQTFVAVRRHGFRCNHRKYKYVFVGGNLPQMQVHDRRATATLNAALDRRPHVLWPLTIEKHATGCSQKPQRPACHEDRADHAHCGIEPVQSGIFAGQQRKDGQKRRQRIGQDVQVRRTKIMVVFV